MQMKRRTDPFKFTRAMTCPMKEVDSLRGSSIKLGMIQRILAWHLRKDDTHKSRSVNAIQ